MSHPVELPQVVDGERCSRKYLHCPTCDAIRCRLIEGHKLSCVFTTSVPPDHPVFRKLTASYTINVYGYGDKRSPEDWRDDERFTILLDLAILLFPDNDVDMEGVLK